MRTPSGKECPYFYGDYHRGRSREECRLLFDRWQPRMCNTCPVPEIAQANACEHQKLTGKVKRPFLLLRPRVEVTAFCNKRQCAVDEPRVGCGHCHSLPFIVSGDET